MTTERRSSAGRDRGFTLIEVVVALCIFGMAVYIAMDIISFGSIATSRDHDIEQAVGIGKNELARVGQDVPLVDGTIHGTTADGFGWQIEITSFRGDEAPDPIDERLKLVRTTVVWHRMGSRHKASFVTLLATRGYDR